MARCSKKTVGGGGCQTCNGSQAKGPAAILIFEAKKKAKRSADGKARRQGESRGKANNPNTEHNQEKKRQEKGEGNGREKTKGARQPGGTEKRDKRNKKKEEQRKNKGKPPQGKAPQILWAQFTMATTFHRMFQWIDCALTSPQWFRLILLAFGSHCH